MMQLNRSNVAALLLSLAGVVVAGAGCDDGSAQRGAPSPGGGGGGGGGAATGGAETLPAGLMVNDAPAGAKSVAEVRGAAADGAEVVVRGRIAGSQDPFTAGRAQFQLVDLSVKSCAEVEGDACPTPWDMCCEEPGSLVSNSVTVQVVGAEGRPLKSELKGVSGLKPLSEVAVKGKVHKSADGKVVTVDASELYVKPG